MNAPRLGAALIAATVTASVLWSLPAAADTAGHSPQEREALAEADSSGERVEVEALRGERREVYANPDGTFTAVEHVKPVRVLRDGGWVTADATLVRHADGRIGPEAATMGLTVSGGGTEPFARLSRAGKELALSWPGELPEPRLDGAEATYDDVLPGVDLVVRADVDGVSHILVVENAEAAANPDLTRFQLALDTDGVQVRERAEGGLEAVDTGAGGAVFEAPVPLMWDSGAVVEDGPAAASLAHGPDSSGELNLVEGPSETSKLAEVGVEVAGDDLTLVPDTDLLSAADTVYPVYIDPVWRTSTRSQWTMVASGYPSQKFWKFAGKKDEGTGRCPQFSGDPLYCNGVGVKRVLYGIPTTAYHGKQILSAEFAVTLRHTFDSTARPVRLYRTGAINSATTWSNQPSWSSLLDTKSPKNAAGSCTSTNQNARFNATAAVTQAANSKWSTTTFGLRAADESNHNQWKRFCDNAQLEVNYNTAPTLPKQSDLQLSPGGACVYGASRPYVDEPPRISAYLRDPDHSSSAVEQVRAQFRVFWTDDTGTEQRREHTTSYKAANSRFYYQIPADIPQNTVIAWIVRAHDGHAWSGWSWDGAQTRCEFVYDATNPDQPTVASYEYPDDDQWHDGVGVYGEFAISSPSTDVVSYRYGINEHPSAANTLTPKQTGGSVRLTFAPEYEGPHSLYVEAVDAAGRVSTRANHLFLVEAGHSAAPHWPLTDELGSTEAADTGDYEWWWDATPAQAGSGVTFGVQGPGGPGTRAAQLDGTDNAYLESNQIFLGDAGRELTVTAWARLDETGRDQAILSRETRYDVDNSEIDYLLGYSAAEQGWRISYPKYGYDADKGGYTITGECEIVAPESAHAGVWAHLALVNDGTREQSTLYVNGRHAASATNITSAACSSEAHTNSDGQNVSPTGSDIRPMAEPPRYAQIGRSLSGADAADHFNGALSDIRFFERMVSAEQINALYTLPTERAAYWPLNDAEDGASPEADDGDPLTLAGDAHIFYSDPFGESALVGDGHLVLDGTGDHAAAPGAPADTDGSFTVTARARLASAQPDRSMSVLSQAGQTQSAFDLRYSAQEQRWEVVLAHADATGAETTLIANDAVQPSFEQSGDHLAIVYDGFAREVRLYVNGQLAQNTTAAHTSWTANGPFTVGRALDDGAWEREFSGAVDDVRVYSGAADAAMISILALAEERLDL